VRIKKLTVYGYGKLHNISLALTPNLHVFFGENEAGKSTTRSFIRHILFGFPTKAQQELRYEPKTGTNYGGSIVVETKEYGEITIERVGRSATGDVTVYFADGRTASEEILTTILIGMDKQLFQDIFSFDLHGLQRIHHIGEDELGKYLFSASMTGTDKLVEVEKKLDKEIDALYKPNGRKPELNVEIQQMKDLYEEYGKWQRKLAEYEQLVETKQNVTEDLEVLAHEKDSIKRKIREIEAIITVQPLLLEEKKYNEFIAELGEVEPFPVDGIKRYDAVLAQLQPLQAQRVAFEKRQAELEQTLRTMEIDENILTQEASIRKLSKQREKYEHFVKEREVLHYSLLEYEKQMEQMKHKLGLSSLTTVDTSFQAKDRAKELEERNRSLQVKKQQLDDNFSIARDEVEQCETNVKHMQEKLLSDEERHMYEQTVQANGGMFHSRAFIQQAKEKHERLKKSMKKKHQQLLMLLVPACVVATIVFLFGVFNEQFSLSLFSLVLFVVCLFVYGFVKKDRAEAIRESKREFDQLERSDSGHEEQMKLQQDSQYRQLVEVELFKYKQAERAYESIVQKFEEWERQSFEVERETRHLCEEINLPHTIGASQVTYVIQQIEEVKHSVHEWTVAKKKLEQMEAFLVAFEQEAVQIAMNIGLHEEDPLSMLTIITDKVEREKERLQKRIGMESKVEEWVEEVRSLVLTTEHLEEEIQQLLKKAEVTDEEGYRAKGKAKALYEEAMKSLSFLRTQISSCAVEKDVNLGYNYEDELQAFEQAYMTLSEKENNLHQQIATVTMQLQSMEEGKAYASLVHEVEMKKAQIKEKIKRWGALTIAKQVLVETKQKYQEERLPQTLSYAEGYFHFLTDGEYVRIFAPMSDQMFVVERQDGQRFLATEVSQGTAEQLYLSLRLALAKTYEAAEKYPLIIDDSFVNFDKKRTERAIMLLHEVAKERQVLFFTCHEHILPLFPCDTMTNLQTSLTR
jgi:uncharacterized protein YhaN